MAKIRVIMAVFSLVLLLPIVSSFSQTPGTKPTLGMGARLWRGENRCWKASDLNLSTDQARGLTLMNQAYLSDTRPLRTELFSRRMELREFLTNPTVRLDVIQHTTSEIIALSSKIEEREIEYLVKVRSLLTQDQVKSWCPEQEFQFLRGMERPEFMRGPINPRKTPIPERPKEE